MYFLKTTMNVRIETTCAVMSTNVYSLLTTSNIRLETASERIGLRSPCRRLRKESDAFGRDD